MQGNWGNIRQWKLAWPCTKISRNKSWSNVIILWNQQVQTDRTIPNNKPDNIICNNKQGTCMSLGVGIPGDKNVIKKGEENLKYKELITEIHHVWNVKAEVITVIIVANGTISKSRNYKNSHIGHCTYTPESTNVKVNKGKVIPLQAWCGPDSG